MSKRASEVGWSEAAGSGGRPDGARCLGRRFGDGAALCAVADSEHAAISDAALEALYQHLVAERTLDTGRHRASAVAVGQALTQRGPGARASMAWALVGSDEDGVIALFGWLGICRVGRIREGTLIWLTRDHSLAEQMVREERLTPLEAVDHPCRKVLVRSFGADAEAEVVRLDPQPGDVLVLATDGVYDALAEAQIALLAAGGAEALVEAARGGAAVLVHL